MLIYIFPLFIFSIAVGVPTYLLVDSRRWMKKHGDGIYNPLRQAYKNAGAKKA